MPVKDPRLASHSYRVTVLACSASGTVMSQILREWYSDRLDRLTVRLPLNSA